MKHFMFLFVVILCLNSSFKCIDDFDGLLSSQVLLDLGYTVQETVIDLL